MRYMMMFKATKDYEAGIPPSRQLMAEMGKLTQEMIKAGVLLASDGLQPSSKGTRIKVSGGKRTVCRDKRADWRLRDSPGEVEGRSDSIGRPRRRRSHQSGYCGIRDGDSPAVRSGGHRSRDAITWANSRVSPGT